MPFYEYECTACKFYVEALQKISDPPLKQCPSCKKQTMKRLVSAPVFRLKGGGWYETDFKSEAEQKRNIAGREELAEAKADDGDKGKAEKKPVEAKAETKAASKPAAKPAPKKPAAKKAAAKPKSKAKAKKSRR